MKSETLKEKTARGLLWGGVAGSAQQLLNLVFGIFLARLLTPADYGMVGMLSVFSLIAATIQESGFTAALINKPEATHQDYNAVFWFNILCSLLLYGLLYAAAPLIAAFYHTPELEPLARYAFTGFVVASLGISHSARLKRELRVRQQAVVSILALVVSGCTGVTLAYLGYSYWGYATQSIVYVCCTTAGYWYLSRWHPTLPVSFAPIRQMFSFSSKLLATGIFQHLNNQLFTVLLGKLYTEREVGYYTQGSKWSSMGQLFVSGMVGSVAQPVLAQVAADGERQLRIFRKLLRFTAFVSFPAMLGLAVVAEEVVLLAITAKWLSSVPALQLLCVGAAFAPLSVLCQQLVISCGASRLYLWNTVALGLTLLVAVLVARPGGLYAMLGAYVAVQVAWVVVWQRFVRRAIGLRLRHAVADVLPYAATAAAVMAGAFVAGRAIEPLWLRFAAKVAMGAAGYIAVLWLAGSQTLRESLHFFLHRGRGRKIDAAETP